MKIEHAGTMRVIRFWLEKWAHAKALERWQAEPAHNASFVVYKTVDGNLRLMPQAMDTLP